MAIATSKGKKIANTGMSRVPNPKPEKSVKPDTTRAVVQSTTYCIMLDSISNYSRKSYESQVIGDFNCVNKSE
jgi:hypothetical protein